MKNIFEIRTIIITAIIITTVVLTGSILYNKLTLISTKISNSINTELPASFVAQQVILELRVAENNARSYHLTQDMGYMMDFYKTAPIIKGYLSYLNKLSKKNITEKPLIDSIIDLSKKRYQIIKQESYLDDPTKVTNELDVLTYKIDEAYNLQEAITNKNESIEKSINIKPLDSSKKKQGFLKRIFAKKNIPIVTIDTLKKQEQKKENKNAILKSEKKLKESVLSVKSNQLEQLENYKQAEYEFTKNAHIIREKIIFYADELKRYEDIEAIELSKNANNEIISIKYYSIFFSIFISILLFILGWFILSYMQKKNDVEVTLRESKYRSDELAKAKETFLANMSHEIKTPLNAIYGFTEQILSSDLNSEQTKQLKIVKNSASYLTKLVNNILTYSKLQAGKEEIELEVFNLTDELLEIEALFKNQATSKGINIQFSFVEIQFSFIKTDLYKLKQILFNIIGNAIKFTNQGSVKVSVKQINKNNSNLLYIQIADTGRGISEAELPKLFNEFEQGNEHVKKKYGGTGLGLVITKKIIEQLAGTIQLESKPKIGTTVTITLPYIVASTLDKPNIDSQKNIIQSDYLKGKRILIADDEEFNRLLIKTILKNQGTHFFEVENGREAIEITKNEPFDIIIMDVQMPDVSGLEATQTIRKFNSSIPIIGATAFANEEKITQCVYVGMNSVIFKPFTEKELMEKLEHIFNNVNLPDNDSEKKSIVPISKPKEIINLDSINEHVNGDEEFKTEMIQLFYKSINKAFEDIKTNYAIKNYKAIGEVAHKIIPSCKHFDAIELIAILKYLEMNTIVKQEDELFYHSRIEAFKDQIKQINEFLKPVI